MSDERNNLTSGDNGRHCKRCDRVDADDDMVCCDMCESWIHFQCAGVSESIAEPDRSFKCSKCLADWDGESKSAVSFNESSVSKSSRASQKLQLSLQLLKEQQNLKKKRAEEERKSRKLEEEAKLKQIDEEQEYLRKRYALLLQIEEDKDSSRSSRKSGVSVKRRCEQLENWLNKGTQVDKTGQSKPTMSEQEVTLPVPVVCLQNDVQVSKPTSLVSTICTSTVPDILHPNPAVPVSSGSLGALAKSYELFASIPGNTTLNSCLVSTAVPATVVATISGNCITTVATASTSVSSIHAPVSTTFPNSNLPSITDALMHIAPVYSYPRMNNGQGLQLFTPMPSLQLSDRSVTNSRPVISSNTGIYSTVQYPSTSSAAVSGVPWLPEDPVLNNYPPASVPFSTVRSGAIPSAIPSSLGMYGNGNHVPVSVGPNSAQLAARQVMPRELPKFNGDPQEWPILYSSFKNTTDVCGYTDAENLARLQRSLGGPALEAVRSRLLLPASVPYVMGTLQKLYGRPEILISSLLKKVRNVPPPKSENLSSIVCYRLAIQNLVDHIVLAEQQAHLSNPMLLQELVDKLPTSLKMQWGTFKQAYTNVNLATFNDFMSGLVNLASELSIDVVSAQNYQQSQRAEKQKQKEELTWACRRINRTWTVQSRNPHKKRVLTVRKTTIRF
ncbi:uncharacterized protein LOC131432862 [Malaya genurostris]|uniref:uncharacterized protein LOC131432862 n=1 Tax=Malaya genurostris TaxID=325434 RepID=UPI0026F380D7|nr:uncharacterized protein LOC131432862 [Malaya genurostris]